MNELHAITDFLRESPKLSTFLIQVVAMLLTCLFIPRLRVTSIFGAIFMVISISLINRLLWDDHLFTMIPMDKTQSTISLFLANGVIFWVLVKLLPGIEVSGVLPALVAPVVFSITTVVVTEGAKNVDWKKVSVVAIDQIHTFRDEMKEKKEVQRK